MWVLKSADGELELCSKDIDKLKNYMIDFCDGKVKFIPIADDIIDIKYSDDVDCGMIVNVEEI